MKTQKSAKTVIPETDSPKTAIKVAPEPNICGCGCDQVTKGGRYMSGHDMVHKAKLTKAALAGDKNAIKQIEQLGWAKYLKARQEKESHIAAKGKLNQHDADEKQAKHAK